MNERTRTPYQVVIAGHQYPFASLYEAVKYLKKSCNQAYLLLSDGSRWGVLGNGVTQLRMARTAAAGSH